MKRVVCYPANIVNKDAVCAKCKEHIFTGKAQPMGLAGHWIVKVDDVESAGNIDQICNVFFSRKYYLIAFEAKAA